MAMRPGPLPGFYIEAVTGIAVDKTAQNPSPEGNERCYIKDCVAAWLGLTIADPRVGRFKTGGTPNPAQTNAGRYYAIRGQRGSYQYKVILLPLTGIPVIYYDSGTGTKITETILRNSFSISLSRTIGVAELRAWLMNSAGANSKGELKEGVAAKIMGLVTPWGRKYIWRTPSFPAPTFEKKTEETYLSANAGGTPSSGTP